MLCGRVEPEIDLSMHPDASSCPTEPFAGMDFSNAAEGE